MWIKSIFTPYLRRQFNYITCDSVIWMQLINNGFIQMLGKPSKFTYIIFMAIQH